MEKYPFYSTLLVLDNYEKEEKYEECAIIKKAIEKYKNIYEKNLPEALALPTHRSIYESPRYQKILKLNDIVTKPEEAKEKAKIIKLNLPV